MKIVHSQYTISVLTDIRDDDDRSPLDLACERGHRYIVQYLVKKANCDVSE